MSKAFTQHILIRENTQGSSPWSKDETIRFLLPGKHEPGATVIWDLGFGLPYCPQVNRSMT